jgi:hypothetical protein
MKRLVTLLCSALACAGAWAENSTRVDGYTIHHNALTTDTLSPKIASAYQIQRSKGRGMVNISIIKDQKDSVGTPVAGTVKLSSRNLLGQKRDIPLREIREGQAVYYIADFAVGNREQLVFDVEVTPEGGNLPLAASFQQEFFVD